MPIPAAAIPMTATACVRWARIDLFGAVAGWLTDGGEYACEEVRSQRFGCRMLVIRMFSFADRRPRCGLR
jgi:hypothetical protein